MERSVERVDGVSKVSFDVSSGRASVVFESGKTAAAADLWEAVKAGGFTPVWVKIGDQVYDGVTPRGR